MTNAKSMRLDIHGNERSYVLEVITEINLYLANTHAPIGRAGGESTLQQGKSVRFPDVILYTDSTESVILQGWEAKCPDTPIDDPAFVADARRKARMLGCNSTVLWNFQYAQLHVLNTKGEFEILRTWIIDERIRDRPAIKTYERSWKAFLRRLIDMLSGYIQTGQIRERSLGDALTDSVMPKIVIEGKAPVSARLKGAAVQDATIDIAIDAWWKGVKREYFSDEDSAYAAYAKNLILAWENVLLFSHAIRNRYAECRELCDLCAESDPVQSAATVEAVGRSTGFSHIFHLPAYAELIDGQTWNDLMALNGLLDDCSVDTLDTSYGKRLFTDCVSLAKRQIAGQYPTPAPLARLMAGIAVRNARAPMLDPCCGTGTIGCALWRRAYDLLEGTDPDPVASAYATTYLSDIHDFPLQIAAQSLFLLGCAPVPMRILQENVFDLEPGNERALIGSPVGADLSLQIPRFMAIASNLPFVDFNTKGARWYREVKEGLGASLRSRFGIELSERNDLYAYIALSIDRLLDDDGIACLLTSNSWLASAAGKSFFQALCHVYGTVAIYVNGAARWFGDDADVMNALVVVGKRQGDDSGHLWERPALTFGIIDASIDELADPEVSDGLRDAIILGKGQANEHFEAHGLSYGSVTACQAMGLSLYSLCFGTAFLAELSESLIKVSDFFTVKRGVKSGDDRFFYASSADFAEPPFVKPAIANLADIATYQAESTQFAFSCSESEEALAAQGYDRTLAHIRSQLRVTPSCKGHRPYWYSLPDSPKAMFLAAMNYGERLFIMAAPDGETVINQRCICFETRGGIVGATGASDPDKALCLALLNSTLGLLLIEASSSAMALGALDTRCDSFKAMSMLDPSLLGQQERDRIVKAFRPLKKRPILPALREMEQADRQRFDDVVLEAFGLGAWKERIYRTLGRLLEVRLGTGH